MIRRRHILVWGATALLWSSCGGKGGGSAPAVTAPRLLLSSVTVAATSSDFSVELSLAGATTATLLQCDLLVDPGVVVLTERVEELAAMPTVRVARVDEHSLRLVFGDATNRDAAALGEGPLLRIHCRVSGPRATGNTELQIQQVIASTQDGGTADFDSTGATATVVIE